MIVSKVPAGHVRALVERPNDDGLAAAATDLLRGEDPARSMSRYARGDAAHEGDAWDGERRTPSRLQIDPTFGAIPIARGAENRGAEDLRTAFREPGKSDRFLVSGFVEASGGRVASLIRV